MFCYSSFSFNGFMILGEDMFQKYKWVIASNLAWLSSPVSILVGVICGTISGSVIVGFSVFFSLFTLLFLFSFIVGDIGD